MNPIAVIIGQAVRAVLNIVAAYLLTVGVSQAQVDGLVAAAVPVVVSIAMFGIAHIWGYASKVNAFKADPNA